MPSRVPFLLYYIDKFVELTLMYEPNIISVMFPVLCLDIYQLFHKFPHFPKNYSLKGLLIRKLFVPLHPLSRFCGVLVWKRGGL